MENALKRAGFWRASRPVWTRSRVFWTRSSTLGWPPIRLRKNRRRIGSSVASRRSRAPSSPAWARSTTSGSKEGIRVNTPHGGGFRWSKPQALGAKSHRPREGSRRTTEALRRYGIGACPSPYQLSRGEREDAGDHRRFEERARPRRALPRSRRAEERP